MDRVEFRKNVLLRHIEPTSHDTSDLCVAAGPVGATAAKSPVSWTHFDGVAVITIDYPPVNSLHPSVIEGLVRCHEEATADPSVAAIVVTGKNGTFVAGADIPFLQNTVETGNLNNFDNFMRLGNALSNALERGPKPSVAAIDGNALGGGLELAMMCNARVCTPRSSLGLPELKLGLIPGFGGTQRLPRLVGLQRALDMMLRSTPVKGPEALKLRLVDELAESSRVVQAAAVLGKEIAAGRVPRVVALDLQDRLEAPDMLSGIIQFARNAVKGRPYNHPTYCINAAEAGLKQGGIQGVKIEQQEFFKCMKEPAARSLLHVFFAERATSKVPGVTDSTLKPRSMRRFAVVGGGLMGSGIATALLQAGCHVILKEVEQRFLEAGVSRIADNFKRLLRSKKMTQQQVDAAMGRLQPQLSYDGFSNVDMVIEAVIENLPLKQRVFAELEAVCNPQCVLATNTSTINIDLVGEKTRAQDRIVGLHFFTPAQVMPLLEIVRTASVSTQVLLDAVQVARMLRKTPIVVGNCVGFTVNRAFFPYGMAGDLLVMHGSDPYRIDKALQKFGLPMGSFRMSDMVGGDVISFVNENFCKAFPERVYVSPLRQMMLADNRAGEKTGKGFYSFAGGQAAPDPALNALLQNARAKHGNPPAVSVTDEEIPLIMLLPVVNEACRIIDEGMVIRPSDIDIATIMGYGFPPHLGGALFWADSLGSRQVYDRLKEFERRFGTSFFAPCAYLERCASQNVPLSRGVQAGSAGAQAAGGSEQGDDDVVIVSAVRTALGKAKRGGFRDTRVDDLVSAVLQHTLQANKPLTAEEVGDIVVGTVLPSGETSAVNFRVAALLAGFPDTIPVRTVNRLCSSGLQAVADVAAGIRSGYYDCGIAAGVESMSAQSMGIGSDGEFLNPRVVGTPVADVYLPMGLTSENVAQRYGVSRREQDAFAAESHRRAAAAISQGKFKSEIVPVRTKVKDPKTGEQKELVVDTDEGVRGDTTAESLAKLRPAFRKDGTSTAGNSSQLTDGAAAVLLMTRAKAKKFGLPIRATLRSFAVVGVEPGVMGIGPAFAIPRALEMANVRKEDIDVYEINEAFASQALYCIKHLGLDPHKVNPNGGAIALGHPLGCTGARQVATLLPELERQGARYGVVSMCIGTGMGAAAVFERC